MKNNPSAQAHAAAGGQPPCALPPARRARPARRALPPCAVGVERAPPASGHGRRDWQAGTAPPPSCTRSASWAEGLLAPGRESAWGTPRRTCEPWGKGRNRLGRRLVALTKLMNFKRKRNKKQTNIVHRRKHC